MIVGIEVCTCDLRQVCMKHACKDVYVAHAYVHVLECDSVQGNRPDFNTHTHVHTRTHRVFILNSVIASLNSNVYVVMHQLCTLLSQFST